MRRLTFIFALAIASPCYAQGFDQCRSYQDAINTITTGNAMEADAAAQKLVTIESNGRCFAIVVAGDRRLNDLIFQQFVRRFESSRTDKEEGASASGTSGTSVISQGPAAKVLSAAVEYGAATRAVDGQVITLRGNAAGLPRRWCARTSFRTARPAQRAANSASARPC